jgi:hypothetical protein
MTGLETLGWVLAGCCLLCWLGSMVYGIACELCRAGDLTSKG